MFYDRSKQHRQPLSALLKFHATRADSGNWRRPELAAATGDEALDASRNGQTPPCVYCPQATPVGGLLRLCEALAGSVTPVLYWTCALVALKRYARDTKPTQNGLKSPLVSATGPLCAAQATAG